MEAHPRDNIIMQENILFGVTKISYGVLEPSYFCNLQLEQTGKKSVTFVCSCVGRLT